MPAKMTLGWAALLIAFAASLASLAMAKPTATDSSLRRSTVPKATSGGSPNRLAETLLAP